MVSLARRKKKEKQILYSKDIDFFWSEINSPFIVFPFPFPFPFPFLISLLPFPFPLPRKCTKLHDDDEGRRSVR